MKTQNTNNKLAFTKANVTELNNNELIDIDGGSSPFCAAVATSSNTCLLLAGAALAWVLN